MAENSEPLRLRLGIRAVAFDWGNTLMRNMPGSRGPMADWPTVDLMPGAVEALERIHRDVICCIATNAGDSEALGLERALERGGIRPYFAHIFTARDLGVAKPDPAFFEAIITTLDVEPSECVMVGDDYVTDVFGAKRMGMRAIWVAHRPVPGRPPAADAVITSLHELPNALLGLPLTADA